MALRRSYKRATAWDILWQVLARKWQTRNAVAGFVNIYKFLGNVNKTHGHFLGLMEKENDTNLKQALLQATKIGKKMFIKK